MKQLSPPKLAPFHLTQAGFDEFQKELVQLAETRKEAVLKLTEARNLGDLSENGLYTAAKGRLRGIDGRMLFLKSLLKRTIVPQKDTGIVSIGSVVSIRIGSLEKKYELVGDFEASPSENKISYKSPLGAVIFGRKVRDTVTFISPNGEKNVTILSVE